MATPKYEYHVLTWGGFYNKEHKDIHGLEGGDYVFSTEKEREDFIDYRRNVSKALNAHSLCFTKTEGFCCHTRTVLHRVVQYKGERYYSSYDVGVNYSISSAKFLMEYKWTPGFNDYPLGEDFEHYDKVKVVGEWITGAFIELDE